LTRLQDFNKYEIFEDHPDRPCGLRDVSTSIEEER
jgi:hypothetical protein